eukprot:TRINITY_DN16226_c0_g1_i1.p1 TRINITY_DN16226_c0_g1~~TRINITY_DN16226_c0_g1_i1.p1  ORF type:complete len:291 (-),score=56.71 TRINITY_DN16226_c0_g1_i1:429-1301(-)
MGCVQPSKADAPDETAQVSTTSAKPKPAPEASASAPRVESPVEEKKVVTVSSSTPAAETAPLSVPVSATPTVAAPTTLSAPATMASNAKVYIVFYSTYGHIAKLAEAIKAGVDSVDGVEGHLYQVPETLPEEVLEKMHAPPKPDIPIIDPKKLTEADGLIFGFPTRYGMMAAQFKAFLDATGSLWQTQALAGKPAGIFVSTGTQGGGQETTALTAITQLAHHGMIFVPVGYKYGPSLFDVNEVRGGSPYGAGTFAGDGSRQPTKTELGLAEFQGKHIAEVTLKLAAKPAI